MAFSSSFAVLAAILTIAGTLLSSLVERYVLRPWLMVRRLRAQGISGHPFRPIVGNLPEFFKVEAQRNKDPTVAATTRATEQLFDGTRKYGKVWYWTSGLLPRVVISDPALIRQVFISKNSNFVKPLGVKKMTLIQNGLVAIDGEEWAKQRRLITPAFHFVELRRLFVTMTIEVKKALQEWERVVALDPTKPLPMDKELSKLTLQVISSTAFGASFSGRDQTDLRLVQEAFETSIKITARNRIMATSIPFYGSLPTDSNRALWASEKTITSVMRRIVAEQVQKLSSNEGTAGENGKKNTSDLLQLLLESTEGVGNVDLVGQYGDGEATGDGDEKKANKQADGNASGGGTPGERMSEQQLVDECITFMGAGHETTSVLLSWTMVQLSQHPEWQEKARQEVLALRGNVPNDKWTPTFDEVSQLKTLTIILQEILRMFPPAPALARTCAVDTPVTESFTIPASCDVLGAIEVMHYSDDYWRSDPKVFNPDRFRDGAAKATTQPGVYIPFGLGPRVCIGQNFAMIEAKLILALLLSRFSWKTAESYKHHPSVILTTKPKHGLPVVLTKLSP